MVIQMLVTCQPRDLLHIFSNLSRDLNFIEHTRIAGSKLKPLTKAQAAVALATGDASDIVNEELVRIEVESMAENVVAVHSAIVAQVEKDINASFEQEIFIEGKDQGC